MTYPLLILCLLGLLSPNLLFNAEALDTEGIIGRLNEARPVKYLVSIKREDKTVCRGGIIGTWIILTAASCVIDKETNDFIPGSMSIVAGYDNATIVADVDRIYVPEGNNSTIAVLKLKQNLNILKNRKILQRLSSPRKLRGNRYKDFLNEPVNVASFDDDNKNYLLNAKVVDGSECTARNNLAIQSNEVCAKIEDNSYAPMRLCEDDLGSPLIYNDKVVVGVLLIPAGRCVINGEPAVYARVSSFLPFINTARYGKKTNALIKVL